MRYCENEDCVKMCLLRKWECVKTRLLPKCVIATERVCQFIKQQLKLLLKNEMAKAYDNL